MTPRIASLRPLAPLGALLAALPLLGALLAGAARADEIVYRDAETCAETTVRVDSIESETWTEIRYAERPRAPTKSVPTAQVLEIRRDGQTPEAKSLLAAIGDLERGNVSDARAALGDLSGGGYAVDLETRKRRYRSFTENDPPGKNQRPPWTSEYAHFFYAKALYQEGDQKKDMDLLNEALLALEDLPVPGGDAKARTGGFLKRFQGGNSRWYANAMLLKAQALVGLGRYEDAEKAYKDLGDKALSLDIGPRWAYEAKLGPGRIAEAGGKTLDAVNAYTDAANFMRLLLEKETRGCVRKEIGRLFSRARVEAAGVMLRQAEKTRSSAEFANLRQFIEQGTPQALMKTYRALPKAQLDALIEGAMDPRVQAVAQTGLGLAYLQEKAYEQAILAFRSVEVKHFGVAEEHARALHYLAEAADAASKQARGAARDVYAAYRDDALKRLREDHPNSPWAGKR
jgi:hypothetical protein